MGTRGGPVQPGQDWKVLRGWLSSGISFRRLLDSRHGYFAGIQNYDCAHLKEVRSLGSWRRTWFGSLPGWFASILHCVIKLSPFCSSHLHVQSLYFRISQKTGDSDDARTVPLDPSGPAVPPSVLRKCLWLFSQHLI